jgi:hypothetical protein
MVKTAWPGTIPGMPPIGLRMNSFFQRTGSNRNQFNGLFARESSRLAARAAEEVRWSVDGGGTVNWGIYSEYLGKALVVLHIRLCYRRSTSLILLCSGETSVAERTCCDLALVRRAGSNAGARLAQNSSGPERRTERLQGNWGNSSTFWSRGFPAAPNYPPHM